MTSRVLPAAEYERLADSYLAPLRHAIPAEARVVVVEHEGQIVASWLAFKQTHLEGCGIAAEYRKNPAVVLHLMRGMRAALRELGANRVFTAAEDDQVRQLLAHLGAARLPGDHYVMEASCLSE